MMSLQNISFGLTSGLMFAMLVVVHDLAGLWTIVRTSPDGPAVLGLMIVALVFVFSLLGSIIRQVFGASIRL